MSEREEGSENDELPQGEAFKRSSKLSRSPQRSVWFSLPSKSASKKSVESGNSTTNTVVDEDRRKSVSFNLPATSSTFYGQGDTSVNNLIDLDLSSPRIDVASQFDYSLDPYLGAQATYSDLNDSHIRGFAESHIRNGPLVVHSLVYLVQNFCAKAGIDCGNILAESSNWKRAFLEENLVKRSEHSSHEPNGEQQSFVVPDNIDNLPENMFEEEMALNLNAIVSGIERFSSKSQEDIESFIASVELYNDLCDENEALKLTVLKTVRSRLKTVTKLGNVQTLSLLGIITRIREKFKLTMSFDAAQEKLLSIQQGLKESIDAFGERTKKLLDVMNSVSTNENVEVQNAQAKMNEKLAVRKFKQNLYDRNVRMMALAVTHDDLYDAISFATEKFEEMRLSNVRQEQPKAFVKENHTQKSVADGKNSNGNMFCHLCKRKNHFTRDCFLKKKNQQDGEQPGKFVENKNKPVEEKKFNRAGKSRSMNQASYSNVDEGGESDTQSLVSDGPQQMQLHTFGAHLNY